MMARAFQAIRNQVSSSSLQQVLTHSNGSGYNGLLFVAVQNVFSHITCTVRHYSTRPTVEDGSDSGDDVTWSQKRVDHSRRSKFSPHLPKNSFHQSHRQTRHWERQDAFHGGLSAYRVRKPHYHNGYRESQPQYGEEFSPRSGPAMPDPLGSSLSPIDWSERKLEPVEKNFYTEHQSVIEMSNEEVDAFYQNYDIRVTRGEKVRPVLDFKYANFPGQLEEYMNRLPWVAPTPIQSLGWPLALSGKNMVAIAQTGSGKTLGFVLPALVHICGQRSKPRRNAGPVVLVLAPTRELAQQIRSVCAQFGKVMGLRSTAIFGGQSKLVQARSLSEGPEIVVATPGRLLDFLETGVISLEQTSYLVLDEADRMLDMGFEPQIRKVLSQIRPDRQLLLWSATWPKEIRQLAHDYLGDDFTQVNIGSASLRANPNIQQSIVVCERREKFNLMVEELEQNLQGPVKTLIFVQTKSQADLLTRRLRHRGFQALSIHGDKSQLVRDKTLRSFKFGDTDILVATDVASRGLDVDDIELVVNFDAANTADDYIHRIGRTARAHKTGRALTFLTAEDAAKARDLISVLTAAEQEVPQELRDLAYYSQRQKQKNTKESWNRPKFGQRRPWH